MSQQKNEATLREDLHEDAIAAYLQGRPDFFERHEALLLGLSLPHETGGSTVSLIERQVSMLRQRNGELERQLKDLIDVAKANDSLVEKIHQLSVRLLRAQSPAERLEQLEVSLREDFGAECATMVLFANAGLAAGSKQSFLKTFAREDPELKPFATFMQSGRTRCGPLRDRQRALLFGPQADAVASAAMLPLGREMSLGFLVIGSNDPSHFHPCKRVDFLNRIGELICIAITEQQARSVAV